MEVVQERERTLELQLHEYCGIREQETMVMELQNRLKISNMETQMSNLKLETTTAVTTVTARDGNSGSGGWLYHVKVVGRLLLPLFDVKLIKETYKANVKTHGVYSGTFNGHVI
ncbi:hypothetical protein PIB30_071118 [Stylosanthes scabra]|uniref:Uncharacterized protein n=1 Tax=Stylosanthes scabra TaxID=79078 RepID=A0ABU6URH0_9FABA|nr:hypothetical protein [Stylosanthes scabra]